MNDMLFYEVGQRVSWTLVHSLWQFVLIAVVLKIGLRLTRGRSPHGRYGVMLSAMLFMAIAPIATFFAVSPEVQSSPSQVFSASTDMGGNADSAIQNGGLTPLFAGGVSQLEHQVSVVVDLAKDPSGQGSLARSTTEDVRDAIANFVVRWMNVILVSWLGGIVLLSLRPLIGWQATRMLRLHGRTDVSDSIHMATHRVAQRLGVRRVIEIAQSTLVEVPTVIGWLRPLVLLPASAVIGLSTQQLEAVIAHELAHVRRHDYLVNLFQLAMETVFFYHPAVWWVSHRMRTEREECCDEIAANMTGDRIGYAKLLVWLEETRQQSSKQTLAMSADGGSLVGRVRRLVSTPAESSGTGSMFIVVSVIFVLAIGSVLAINADSSLAQQPVAADDDRLAVQVVDDISVKMIAVLPQQATAEEAWRPNGELFEELPYLPKVTDDSPAKPIPGIDYVFKFKGLKDDQNPTYTTEGLKGWRQPSDDGFVRIETQPYAESTSTTIEIGIPDNEWGPWVSVSIDGEIIAPVDVPLRLQNAHSIMRVHDARARGDRTMLRWAYDRDERKIATFDLVAVDKDGKRLQTWGRTLWDDEDGVTRSAEVFNHPIDQIDHFEYRLRPYRYWVTFDNVSLKPGQKTSVKTSVETVPIPPADDLGTSLSPPADPKSQSLGEQVHWQLSAISKLNSALISTQSFTSYYGDPKGRIGLKDERSLEHLRETLSKRDFDKSLSTTNHTWAWDNKEVVSTERHKYVYEDEPYDQTSEHTWNGKRGWRRDSNGSFGRYRTFADAFVNHYFKPSQFMHLGDHRFAWVERGKEPSFFLSSTIPVEYANYQSLGAEDFGGEPCHVIRSIPREEQFWISQKTGRLRGCLKFISQGRFTWLHEMESTRKLAGRSFDSREEFGQWFDEALTDEQRYQLHCEFLYLHQANQHPKDLIEFSDYREVASGIEMPMTEWWSSWMHEGKQYKYNINQTVVREVKVAPDLQPLVDKALPNKGDAVNDWRFATFVKYVFDPEMAESEIHAMVDKAMQEQASNKKQLDRILKPLKEMVGKPAPKLDGQWITAEKLPDSRQEKPTLFHFWATWCGPCKNDIPMLNKMQENGWAIVGVHAPGTETDEIKKAIDDSDIEYPVLLGSETEGVGSQPDKITGYPVHMFPCCVLVDKDGKVQAVGSLHDVVKQDR